MTLILDPVLNVFFIRSFAKHMKSTTPVTINAVNPGLCISQLRRNIPFPASLFMNVYCLLLARTTEVGSRTLVHASLWGTKAKVNGKYLNKCLIEEEESDYVISSEGVV